MTIQTVAPDAPIKIPPSVAVCPICGEEVVIEIEEWEQLGDGSWAVTDGGVHVDCITEPDIDSDEWDEWHDGHWNMPYVDWLPVQMKVYRWLRRHYRFQVN